MKKRIFSAALALTLWAGSATAAVLTDAPGTPTQDRAVDLTAAWADGQATDYDLAEQPADLLTMNTSKDVFLYVYEQENRPVTWYPEQTQRAIAEMAGCDPDALHMSELFRLHAPETDVQSDLDVTLTLDIDYAPGQLTVAVLGDTSDPENVVWTPVESRVTKVGQVELVIPKALMEQLQGEDVPAGEVPLSEIQDALSEQVLEDLQEAAYNDQIAQWIADADAKYYPERLQ